MATLTDMMSKFVSANIASSSGSGTLPGNTITNPKEELKGITTRSGVAYQGPKTPSPSKQGTKPVVAPVSAPMPNLKPFIQYPSRRDNEKRHDQANEQIEKFYEIFKEMIFEISFMDALILMPKFASTLKALIENMEKLSEMARKTMNEHCLAVILNKLPRKLGEPGKFLIPCEFSGMDECLALADLGASINLMPLLVWEGLSLPDVTPTCMTLELADRLVSKSIGIAKDVSFKVGVFHFPADFVVVDFESDPRVPLILGSEPLPPLHNQEPNLPSFKEELKAYEAQTVKSSVDEPPEGINLEFINHKILIEEDYKPAVQHQRRVNLKIQDVIKKEVEKLLDVGLIYPISDSPWVGPMLKRLARNEYYCFLDGFFGYFQIPIDPRDQEKTTFTCPYGTFAYRRMPFGLCNDPGTFQRCMFAIFHDMVEKTMEVFMDDFSVYGNSFENCLSCLDKLLQRCEDTNLSLNWEKTHFMVKEGIVLGHKISKNRIEVDRTKVDVIAKLPHPTTVKGIRSFLGHAGFYRRFIQVFSKISRPMTHLLEKNTPFVFFEDYIQAFQTLKKKLTEAPILIVPNWDLPFELMCDASDFAIGAVLRQRHEKHFKPIHYASKTMNDAKTNYTTTEKEMLAVVYAFEKFRSYLIMNKIIVYTDHSALKYLFAKKDAKARFLRWVLLLQEFDFKVLDTKGAENLAADHLSRLENPYENVLDPKEINETFPLETLSMVTFRGDSSAPPVPVFTREQNILVAVDYLSKWVEAKVLPTNDARVVCKFLKSLFARFGSPRAIISDRGTHFCNDQFSKVMLKYGVTHRLSTTYHLQTSGQVEVSNRGLKRILERTIGENRASWSNKLDDALWDFCTAYKTPIRCTPYKLVYGKPAIFRSSSKIKPIGS
nr:reverse transcriptase domain-containing protein [Tanacetum cinerariifolium]